LMIGKVSMLGLRHEKKWLMKLIGETAGQAKVLCFW
jgi:hypothetical protein